MGLNKLAHRIDNGTIMKAKIIAIACLPLALVACGGGGGGGGTTAATTPSALVLTAKVNGATVASFTVAAGETKVLGISNGQEVEIDASQPAVLLNKSFGAAQANETVNTSTQYKATVSSVNHTIGKLVFSSTTSPTPATVTLAIRGSSTTFDAVPPKVGDAFTYSENDVRLDNTPVKFDDLTHAVTVLKSDGGWTEEFRSPSNSVVQVVQFTVNGNRTSYHDNTATTANGGCIDAGFNPEERLLAFPLTENGNGWTGQWTTSCGSNSQVETFVATPKGFETITTAAGVFNALRIETTTTVTNSTDVGLKAVGGGYQQTVTEWFDPVLGRNIRYQGARTYPGGNPSPASAYLSKVNIDLVKAIKN
jgi:hypothetical protein